MTVLAEFTPADLGRIITIPFLIAFYGTVIWAVWKCWLTIRSGTWKQVAFKVVPLLALCVGGAAMRLPGLAWTHDIYESKMVYGKFMNLPSPSNKFDSEPSFTGDGVWMHVLDLPESYWSWLAANESDLVGHYPLSWSPGWLTTKWHKTPPEGKATEIVKYLTNPGLPDDIRHLLAWASTQSGGYYTYSEDPKMGYLRYVEFRLLIPASRQAIYIFHKV